MGRINPVLPRDYNFSDPWVAAPKPETETTNDICDHEHSFACYAGEGWNSGCCGKAHGAIKIEFPRPLRAGEVLRIRDLAAGFERTE